MDNLENILKEKSNIELKIFSEIFLYETTIIVRAIWSDNSIHDSEKIESLKLINELNHKVWNITFSLNSENECSYSSRLIENIKFYFSQSSYLFCHLPPLIKNVVLKFKKL